MILADENFFTKYNLSSVTYIDKKTQKSNQFMDIIKEENDSENNELDVNFLYYTISRKIIN